tara:strand:+ start:327 stop:779 length:453 start_codon:yes stop_codon:yes gene_type:complete
VSGQVFFPARQARDKRDRTEVTLLLESKELRDAFQDGLKSHGAFVPKDNFCKLSLGGKLAQRIINLIRPLSPRMWPSNSSSLKLRTALLMFIEHEHLPAGRAALRLTLTEESMQAFFTESGMVLHALASLHVHMCAQPTQRSAGGVCACT